MKKRLFFFCALFTVVGILIGFIAKEFYLFFLAPLVFIPFAVYKRKFAFSILILLFTLSAINSSCGYKEVDQTHPSCYISGTVTDVCDGENKSFIISDVLVVKPDETTLNFDNVFVSFLGTELPIPGQSICFDSPLYPYAYDAKNTGERSTRTQAIAENIFLRAYSTNFTLLEQKTTAKSIIYSLKGVIFNKIFSSTDNKEAAGILYAFLTGDRAYICANTFSSFQAAGASHILALSGLHTGIIIFILSRLLDFLKASKTLKLILIGTFLVLFCAFTGFSPSIIRASIMAGIMLTCSAFGFRYDLLNSLSLAATIILLLNPYRLFDVSFLLSFSAVLGIACLPSVYIKNKLLAKLYSLISVAVGATVFTLPLSLYFFSATSIVSIIFNLIMVPIASAAVFLTVIFIFLPAPFLKAPIFLADLLLRIANFATRFPLLKMLSFSAVWVALILIVLFLLTKFTQIKRLFKIVIAVLLCIFLLVAPFIKDTSAKINVLADTRELCVHISANKNIFIGLDETNTFLNYVSANMRHIDTVILLDKDDVAQFDKLRQAGVNIKSVIAPENTYIDTELNVVLLKENQEYCIGNLIFYYSSDGLTLSYQNKRFLLGSYSLKADVSIFYLENFGACVFTDKLFNTYHYGMITIKNDKILTFCGD